MNLGHTNTLFCLWKPGQFLIDSPRQSGIIARFALGQKIRRGASADF
jgi:hypothetical protein